jgi:hypothetical protein
MAIHIGPACHRARLPPYQNIIVSISSGPALHGTATSRVPAYTPWG